MLKGIDISHYQKSTIIKPSFDFVICKASEGEHMQDKDFAKHLNYAKKQGITLFGAYHYAKTKTDPLKNAQNFLDAVCKRAELGDCLLLALDIEGTDMTNQNSIAWCLTWLKEVERVTGIKPVVYTSATHCNKLKPILENNNGLWVAHWGAEKPNTGVYPFWALWQYKVEVNLDFDYFNGNRSQYLKYCRKK